MCIACANHQESRPWPRSTFNFLMPESFIPDKNSSAGQSIFQGLPAAKILDLSTPAPFAASTGTAATVLANIAKIGAPASLLVGVVLLISYLRDEGAPLPAADTSISVLLSLVCIIFIFIATIPISAFLLPTFAKLSDNLNPEAGSSSVGGEKSRQVGQQRFEHLWEYLFTFGPYLCFLLFVSLGMGLSGSKNWRWIAPALISLASFAVYCWFFYKVRYLKFNYVWQSNAYSLMSFAFFFPLTIAIISLLNWDFNIWLLAAISVIAPLTVHVLAVTVVRNWRAAVAISAVMMVVLPMLLGWGNCGGLALRFIGIGGGVPVSIKVRTYSGTGIPSGIEEVTGCLILMTAGDVLIRSTARIADCKLHWQLMGGQSLAQIGTYSRVERYIRGDVVRISKFADPCGTVDGLQVASSGCNPIGLR